MKLEDHVTIEDPRGHPATVVESLRAMLESGVHAELDPRRGDCYDLEDGACAYYIYVSPVSGRVVLLASCLKDSQARSQAASAGPPFLGLSRGPSFGSLALVP